MDVSMQSEVFDARSEENSVDVVSIPAPSEVNKKRGRPKKEVFDADPIQWSIEMIRTLLEQRELLKNDFLDSKDKVALSRRW